jgi:hypothetical protein
MGFESGLENVEPGALRPGQKTPKEDLTTTLEKRIRGAQPPKPEEQTTPTRETSAGDQLRAELARTRPPTLNQDLEKRISEAEPASGSE